ncbi:DNA-directed DNA polymerase [Tanacetum coccineum]
MEEMLYKFIDEGKREHEEMRAFICDFETTNELLFKERINSLIELIFGVQELLKVMNNVQMIDYEVKGVTTRVPFPRRLRKEKEEAQQKKFLENLKQLHINFPFIEALAQMLKYAKFLKSLLTNKARLEEAHKITMNEICYAVLLNKLPSKEKDPGSFTIPCDIGQLHIDNALADLRASTSLMPYTMHEKLGLGEPKATRMSLELADRSIQYPRGIIENVLIKVDKFVLPIDFVILDMPEDSRVPIILGRPFLATARAIIDMFNKNITLRVGDDEVIFDVDQSIKRPTTEDDECYGIDDLGDTINEEAQELLANAKPDSFLSRGLENPIDQSDLEYCESADRNNDDDSDLKNSIRRINFVNTPMPFGLCNAPATFQRCMMAIFHDMVEDFMEVFMDDFSVFDNSFDCCLANLDRMLARCEETNLGTMIDRKFKPIYYTSKTLNNAQEHYTTTEKELLAVIFSFDKFHPYLVLLKTIVYTDHSALKYLFNKQDAKPRLISWVLLLHGFEIEIKDKRGAENLAADHLSRLENQELSIFTE